VNRQHTPRPNGDATRTMVVERKVKPDGNAREYPVELVHDAGGLVVVRFQMTRGGTQAGGRIVIPAGSTSDGYFWKKRPYNLYRMKTADGAIIAHRFDAVKNVAFDGAVVLYEDLILDWWVLPGGEVIEEDRDEYEAARAAGTVSAADSARTDDAARQVLGRYRHIIDEAEALECRHGFAM
jgi:predicted RNA-binding protein associated with RNAse of E/G family